MHKHFLSIVVPVHNEEEIIQETISSILEEMSAASIPFEVVVIDDGSTDKSVERISHFSTDSPNVTIHKLDERRGKSAAWTKGFLESQGDFICTIDGDFQNDPKDIPKMFEKLLTGYDCISGWRTSRQAPFLKKIPSYIANTLLRAIFRTSIHDQGVGIKIFRKESCPDIFHIQDYHRLFAIYFEVSGKRVSECPVNDRPRMTGKSKYGLMRTFSLLIDIYRLLRYANKKAQ